MTLRHLEIFKCVCESGSITRAAAQLNMTQPAVSKAIKELESFYSVELFERIRKRIYITESGAMLKKYADSVVNSYEESVALLRDKNHTKNCRLGVNVSFAEMYIPQIMENVQGKYADIDLRVVVDNTSRIEKKLFDNDIDFAVADGFTNLRYFEAQSLMTEHMVVVCSKNICRKKSMSLGELACQPLLLREKGSSCRYMIESRFAQKGLSVVPEVESVSSLSLLKLVESGAGYGIFPRCIVAENIENNTFIEIDLDDCDFSRCFELIFQKGKSMTPAFEAVLTEIKEYCANTSN